MIDHPKTTELKEFFEKQLESMALDYLLPGIKTHFKPNVGTYKAVVGSLLSCFSPVYSLSCCIYTSETSPYPERASETVNILMGHYIGKQNEVNFHDLHLGLPKLFRGAEIAAMESQQSLDNIKLEWIVADQSETPLYLIKLFVKILSEEEFVSLNFYVPSADSGANVEFF
jgi:hypothetical protein